MLGISGVDSKYQQELSNVLDRKGLLQRVSQAAETFKAAGSTAEEAIASAAENGLQLDPLEQEYLRAVLR
jgi:hypothetical protein